MKTTYKKNIFGDIPFVGRKLGGQENGCTITIDVFL